MRWIHPFSTLALILVGVQAHAAEPARPAPDPLVREIVADNTAFAIDLYAQLRLTPGNVFFSPASISTALAMTLAGARGETAAEMRRSLHLRVEESRVDEAFARLSGWLEPPRAE